MIDFGKCFTFAIDRIKANPVFYIVAGLLTVLLPGAISLGLGLIVGLVIGKISGILNIDFRLVNILAQIVGTIINVLVTCLVMAPVLAAFFRDMESENKGENVQPGSLINCFGTYTQAAVAYLISSVIVGIGLLLCIIPGLLLSPIVMMSLFFVSRGDSAMDAIKKSFDILKSNPMTILYTIVFYLIASVVGLLACCIGVIVTVPMAYAAFYKMMKQILGEDGSPANPGTQAQIKAAI